MLPPLGATNGLEGPRRAAADEFVQRPPPEVFMEDHHVEQRDPEQRQRATQHAERLRVGFGDLASICAPLLSGFEDDPVVGTRLARRLEPAP